MQRLTLTSHVDGAAARLAHRDDTISVSSYAQYTYTIIDVDAAVATLLS
jgi:aspartate 1-decarboxylase